MEEAPEPVEVELEEGDHEEGATLEDEEEEEGEEFDEDDGEEAEGEEGTRNTFDHELQVLYLSFFTSATQTICPRSNALYDIFQVTTFLSIRNHKKRQKCETLVVNLNF